MAPVVRALGQRTEVESLTCVTGQHRGLLDQVLEVFEIVPDIDLDLMAPDQRLPLLTSRVLTAMDTVLAEVRPDLVLVHGDTTTAFATALAAFYAGIPVAHVEAGLRTHDVSAPFPEELNRQVTARIARWNFAPTLQARRNLLTEGVLESRVHVVGNTIVDSLNLTVDRIATDHSLMKVVRGTLGQTLGADWESREVILVTAHRRENFGQRLEAICRAIAQLAAKFPNALFVYPVHPNPQVIAPAKQLLAALPNVRLIEPLEYPAFVWLLNAARLTLTDSGGVQEEAPILGKPVLLMRDTTERPEGVEAGVVRIVGADEQTIVDATTKLLVDDDEYARMSSAVTLLGDGTAANQITNAILAEAPRDF